MNTAIFYVEKELGAHINMEYPLMKFYEQLEELQKHAKKEKEEYDKMSGSSKTIGR